MHRRPAKLRAATRRAVLGNLYLWPLCQRPSQGDALVSAGFSFISALRQLSTLPRLGYDCLSAGPLGRYIWLSSRIPGWTRGHEALALARACHTLPEHAVVVEIGSFLGSSAVLLAGARKLRGSGRVYCVDPFDASGDAPSAPIYEKYQARLGTPLREACENNLRNAGLLDWVQILQGRASTIAQSWTRPIDLLFMDGDHSYSEVKQTYSIWAPHLKVNGLLAVHNSTSQGNPQHDGSRRLVAELVRGPRYTDVKLVDTTTFAVKANS